MDDPRAGARAEIHRRFVEFAASYSDLPLYGRLAAGCADDPEVADLLLAATPGQQRPVLLFAAVHDLVLRRPDLPLARWYASITPSDRLATDDPWPVFRATCLTHRDALEAVVARRSTQTNEVNRAVLVAMLAAAACADTAEQPVSLVEVGTSAGLLLGFDAYRLDVGGAFAGDPDSAVHCRAEVRGPTRPDLSTLPRTVVDRVGIDLAPVRPDDAEGLRWLEACLWPDQPWRIERFRAAVAQQASRPPTLIAGDAVDALAPVASTLPADTHLVVWSTWAMTYLARPRRAGLVATLAGLASTSRPVSLLTAEPPGCVPDVPDPRWDGDPTDRPDSVLGLRRWRDGTELAPVSLGWAHPHGNWLLLDP